MDSEEFIEKVAEELAKRWGKGMNRIAPEDMKVKKIRIKNYKKGIKSWLAKRNKSLHELQSFQ